MKLRSWLYLKGFFSSFKSDAFKISVGNLSMGGSGKTPVVIYLSKLLIKKGYRTAAISRGYRGAATQPFNVVSDGKNILLKAEQSGDEPRLIAEAVLGLVVLTGKKRIHPCTHAIQEYNCNTIILDDAFQHLSVKRDLDLVLFNAAALFENMNVFPSGYLREPLSALRRADSFIITGCNPSNISSVNKFCSYLTTSFPNKPIFRNHHAAQCLVDTKGNNHGLNHITEPVLAFCGIASPSRFKNTLLENSIVPADFLTFNDHKVYSPLTIKNIENHAKLKSCNTLITTTKDMVKLTEIETNLKIYALKMNVEFDQSFDNYILNSISNSLPSV
jgi:tetraacyldisaccharide 4'-kinase